MKSPGKVLEKWVLQSVGALGDAYRQEVQPNHQVTPYPNRQILGHICPAQIGQSQYSSPALGRLEQPARVMSDFGSIDAGSVQDDSSHNKVSQRRLSAFDLAIVW